MQTELRALLRIVAGTMVFVIAGCSGGGAGSSGISGVSSAAEAYGASLAAPAATAALLYKSGSIVRVASAATALDAETAQIAAISPADSAAAAQNLALTITGLPAAPATSSAASAGVTANAIAAPSAVSAPSAAAVAQLAQPAAVSSSGVKPSSVSNTAAPAAAQAVGYTVRTFGPSLTLASENSTQSGSLIYRWAFFGESVPGNAVVQNSDGSLTFNGGGNSNAQASSAAPADTADKFHGVAFGGGAYFEAKIKFNGWQTQLTNSTPLAAGFPSFWSMAIEHLAGHGADQWPEQKPGYTHFIEFDFFEYNSEKYERSETVYSGTIHDWYGVYGVTCPEPLGQFCDIQSPLPGRIRGVPAGTNFAEYHTYGALWVPATAKTPGYMRWYFDGVEFGQSNTWNEWTNPAGASSPGALAFSIGDRQHVALILGTGVAMPMTVSSISVWQATAANNLTN